MMATNDFLALLLLCASSICSTTANAAGTAFDCDVPPDHFSSVSQDIVGPMMITGSVQLVSMRSGRNLPVAGARIVSADGKDSVGFQLVAASAQAKQFDVVLNTKRSSDLKRQVVAQVATEANVPFSLSLDDKGRVKLNVGGNDHTADFIAFSRGKGMAFCSTAQFKFAGLLFSQSR
jgi:hypothetical protein